MIAFRPGARRALVAIGAATSLLVPFAWITASPSDASSMTFVVDNAGDPVTGTPANCPAAPVGTCTLRDAVAAAVANPGDDTISITVGPISLSHGALSHSSTDKLTVLGNGNTVTQTTAADVFSSTADIEIDNLTIHGGVTGVDAGTNATINGSTITGTTGDGVSGSTSVTVTGSSITGGTNGVDSGGSASVTNSTVSGTTGDGVFGSTSVTVTGSSVTGGGNGVDSGGSASVTNSSATGTAHDGVFGSTTVTVTGSTVANSGANGVDAGGNAVVINSTVSGNASCGVAAGDDVTLAYATVVGNGGGPCQNNVSAGEVLTSFGSVIALPTTANHDCALGAAPASQGYNFASDSTCEFGSGPGDQSNAGDPSLGPLGSNGGPTQTRLPLPGSLLLDKIPISACGGPGGAIPTITTDQRGVTRPQGPGCDIGAVEVAAAQALTAVPTFTG